MSPSHSRRWRRVTPPPSSPCRPAVTATKQHRSGVHVSFPMVPMRQQPPYVALSPGRRRLLHKPYHSLSGKGTAENKAKMGWFEMQARKKEEGSEMVVKRFRGKRIENGYSKRRTMKMGEGLRIEEGVPPFFFYSYLDN
ncbi:Methylmalonic aciduria type A protein, mitochondrial precursor [Sesbania bispinosa]|nr:Methylmalonic aciduria type A protein, mitochondrial precursor [Sesbania bispinosa]